MIYLLTIIGVTLVTFILFKIYYNFSIGMCKCSNQMKNKVVIVTGSNTGIGFETAKDLGKRGAKVILACRDKIKGIRARDIIAQETGNNNVIYKHLDLASFKSVRAFADDILNSETRLDVLINNAGVNNEGNFLTEDNVPIEQQVNYFSPFLLTVSLLPLLRTSAPSRIINVSSLMHWFGKVDVNTFHKQAGGFVDVLRVYSNTKLANILFTRKLSEMLQDSGVTVNSLHPGAVNTDIFRDQGVIFKFFIRHAFKTAFEGAQTSIHLAVSEDLKDVSGKYFADCRETATARNAEDDDVADALWKLSEKVVCWDKKLN